MPLVLRIALTVAGPILLVGLIAIATIHSLMSKIFRDEVDQQALAIATNLSDAAEAYIVGRNFPAIDASVARYAALAQVAYTLITDNQGKIVAHSLGDFPPELQGSLSAEAPHETLRRTFTFRGKQVYETRVPIGEEQLGAVHVGIWAASVEQEIRRAIMPLIGLLAIILLVVMALAAFFARRINRQVLQLTQIADRINKGDLNTPVDLAAQGEIGDLACSLERMRVSLSAATLRLRGQRS